MDKNVIKQIILWQQEFVGKVRLQNRSVSFDENANYVLVGIRRAGKSYMLYQHIQHLVAQGHSREEILLAYLHSSVDEVIQRCSIAYT